MAKWTPTYPDAAVGKEGPDELREADLSGKPWEPAPSDSHVQEFRHFDARDHTFLKKFGERGGASQIHVRFRPQGKRPMKEYVYFFADHAEAARVYAELRAAASPGEVLHGLGLTTGKVPYRREV